MTWGEKEQAAFNELREKLASPNKIGVPHPTGEIILITDSSDIGGGSTLFQWQPMKPLNSTDSTNSTILQFSTSGLNSEGQFLHDYPEDEFLLVPLGHWNWKWNSTRSKYPTYELEILSGVLTMASQFRIVAGHKILWFCDNRAVKTFLDQAPPVNPRLRRWFLFLSQFPIKIEHIPGLKNELCDFLSRHSFDEKYQLQTEKLAQDAFSRMDTQLDLSIRILSLQLPFVIDPNEYDITIWTQLEPYTPKILEDKLWFRNDSQLFCERKLSIPDSKILDALHFVHQKSGHPGSDRTLLMFYQNFHSMISKSELLRQCRMIVSDCEICTLTKVNTPSDRGIVGALPIPSVVNSILYIDFVSMDLWNDYSYILVVVCGLSRFAQFIPCSKSIRSDQVFKKIFEHWISKYGKPQEIISDNDIRLSPPSTFYRKALNALQIKVSFVTPYHPQGNGLCERVNRSMLQNLRILSQQFHTLEWPRLLPICEFDS